MKDMTMTLIKAKSLIKDKSNWTQHKMFDQGTGACCSMGAIVKAMYPEVSYHNVMDKCATMSFRETTEFVRETIGDSIAEYNDCPKTTHQDIMNMFDDAILRSESPFRWKVKNFFKNVRRSIRE